MKNMFKKYGFAAVALMLVLTVSVGQAQAAEIFVGTPVTPDPLTIGTTVENPYTDIQTAINAATTLDGDTINVEGDFVITTTITVNKAVIIQGTSGAKIETSGSNSVFVILASNVVIKGIDFVKTDVATQSIITVQGANTTIENNTFTGQYVFGAAEAVRALEISTTTDLVVKGNTFTKVRQPAYINDNTTGTIENNYTTGTKGWVVVGNSTISFVNNSWGTNAVDIAIIPAAINNYTDVITISATNNNAIIINKAFTTPTYATTYVEAGVSSSNADLGSPMNPFQNISDALAATIEGGKIVVKSGTYLGDVTINKAVTIEATNAQVTGRVLITSSNVSVSGLTVTNPAYTGPTIHGFQIWGGNSGLSNVTLKNNTITDVKNLNTKGSYGIMVQGNVSNITLDSNTISGIDSQGWARGIEVSPACGITGVPSNIVLKNNTVSGITSPTGAFAFSIDASDCSGVVTTAVASNVSIENNTFTGPIRNLDTTTSVVDLTPVVVVTPSTRVIGGGGGGSSRPTTTPVVTTPEVTTPTAPVGQVLGETTYNFTTLMKVGTRSNEVKELQKFLNAGNFGVLAVDGVFGPMTKAAVMAFQRANLLVADGIVGPMTRAALNK